MSENTKIEWADHTFNPWVGCTKVSPACDHCYAEGWAKRTGQSELWSGERRRTTTFNWKQPLKWNRDHEAFFREYGHRQRVFCASLADIFDNQVPDEWRDDFWQLVRETPNLDWMLLTKRPQNMRKMLPTDWSLGYPNVWLGATAENQKEADRRIPSLLGIPAVVHFLSCEPLLGELSLQGSDSRDGSYRHYLQYINWIIAGGESGPGARPSHPDWFRSLRDQCHSAGVAFHFKQWGEWAPLEGPLPKDDSRIDYLPDNDNAKSGEYTIMYRIGKSNAGRMLDGRTWDEFPEVAQ